MCVCVCVCVCVWGGGGVAVLTVHQFQMASVHLYDLVFLISPCLLIDIISTLKINDDIHPVRVSYFL